MVIGYLIILATLAHIIVPWLMKKLPNKEKPTPIIVTQDDIFDEKEEIFEQSINIMSEITDRFIEIVKSRSTDNKKSIHLLFDNGIIGNCISVLRQELRVNYLIEAWRLLESASNRNDNKLIKNIEVAKADIQLFGNSKQIELAQEFAVKFSETKQGSLNLLLSELRTNLREELKLEKVSSELRYIRIDEIKGTNK